MFIINCIRFKVSYFFVKWFIVLVFLFLICKMGKVIGFIF